MSPLPYCSIVLSQMNASAQVMHIAAVSEIVNLLIPSLVTLHVRPLCNPSLSHGMPFDIIICTPHDLHATSKYDA